MNGLNDAHNLNPAVRARVRRCLALASPYRVRFVTWLVLLFMVALVPTAHLAAQDDATLAPFSSVTGEITSGAVDTWQFTAVDGEVISLIAEGTGNFDPVLALRSETGALLLEDDDYDYPNTRTAALQAVTAPFTGTYTVEVSGFGDSAGAYTLTRLRGFADGLRLNGFTNGGGWESANDDLTIDLSGGQLALALEGNDVAGFAVDEAAARLTDYYAQVSVTIETGSPGWVAHMTGRQQNANTYYVVSISDEGFWRVARQAPDGETVLRDWITHPAIRAGETSFNLGMMLNGSRLDVFYNGSPLGTFSDEALRDGVLGLGVETSPGISSEVEVIFTDLFITAPLRTAAETDIPVSDLILRDPLAMAQSLENRRVIPTGGELALNVPQSTAQLTTPGVLRVPLGRGTTFDTFVLATNVSVGAADTGEAGCGLFLRATAEDTYVLAYLDQMGAYGLAARQGEAFLPGVYGQREELRGGEHQLLVIALDERIQYFVDGRFVGQIEHDSRAGGVGNAAVNFAPNVTNCTFDDTWLWAW